MIYNGECLSDSLMSGIPTSGFKNIRLLTLNLFLRPPLVKNNQSDHKDARAKYFCQNIIDNYDVICLQEVFSTMNSRRSQIISSAASKGFLYSTHAPAPGFFRPQVIDGGLLILSRFPIEESDFLGFGNGLFPDLMSYKGILHAKIQIGSKSLHSFTIHSQATYPSSSQDTLNLYKEARKEQLKTSVAFIKSKTQSNNDSFFIAGDFNIDAFSDEYSSILEALQELEVIDIIRSVHGKSFSTYGVRLPSGEPEETVLSHRNENTRDVAIDYIFLSKRGDPAVFAECTNVEPFYISNHPFTRISDHYGVQTTISIT